MSCIVEVSCNVACLAQASDTVDGFWSELSPDRLKELGHHDDELVPTMGELVKLKMTALIRDEAFVTQDALADLFNGVSNTLPDAITREASLAAAVVSPNAASTDMLDTALAAVHNRESLFMATLTDWPDGIKLVSAAKLVSTQRHHAAADLANVLTSLASTRAAVDDVDTLKSEWQKLDALLSSLPDSSLALIQHKTADQVSDTCRCVRSACFNAWMSWLNTCILEDASRITRPWLSDPGHHRHKSLCEVLLAVADPSSGLLPLSSVMRDAHVLLDALCTLCTHDITNIDIDTASHVKSKCVTGLIVGSELEAALVGHGSGPFVPKLTDAIKQIRDMLTPAIDDVLQGALASPCAATLGVCVWGRGWSTPNRQPTPLTHSQPCLCVVVGVGYHHRRAVCAHPQAFYARIDGVGILQRLGGDLDEHVILGASGDWKTWVTAFSVDAVAMRIDGVQSLARRCREDHLDTELSLASRCMMLTAALSDVCLWLQSDGQTRAARTLTDAVASRVAPLLAARDSLIDLITCLFVGAGMEFVLPIRHCATFVSDMLHVLNRKRGSGRCHSMPEGASVRWTAAVLIDVTHRLDMLMPEWSADCDILLTKIADGVPPWEPDADALLAPDRIDLRRRLLQNPAYKSLASLAKAALAMMKAGARVGLSDDIRDRLKVSARAAMRTVGVTSAVFHLAIELPKLRGDDVIRDAKLSLKRQLQDPAFGAWKLMPEAIQQAIDTPAVE